MMGGSLAEACSMCTGWSGCPPPVSGDTAHTQTTLVLHDVPCDDPLHMSIPFLTVGGHSKGPENASMSPCLPH